MSPTAQDKIPSHKLASLLSRLSRDRRRVLEGGDPEALHDFRVTLRRLRALLGLMRDCYPSRRLAPIREFLKKTAKSTNDLRDQEVLCSIWASLPGPGPVLGHWMSAQGSYRARLEKEARAVLAAPALGRRLSGLASRLALDPLDPLAFAKVTKRFKKRRRDLANVLKKVLGSSRGERLVHVLRVEAKRVRYALEEWESLMPRRGRKLSAECKRLQDTIGEWRDLERARETLKDASLPAEETAGWMEELDSRREYQWGRFKKAAKALRKRLN